jgi:hypothetical protein
MPPPEWPLMNGADALPGVFTLVAVVLGLAVAIGVAAGLVGWKRQRGAAAEVVRAAVARELERDPALGGLRLTLATRTPWAGETTVWVAGVVPSPWYRYAVMRAAARAVAHTHRPARIVDEIAIAGRRAGSPAARRSA